MKNIDVKGILPAIVTPFDDNDKISFPVLEQVVDAQFAAGVHGLTPMGSTGEYYAMTPTERADVLRAVKEAADGRGLLIAGTNGGSTREVLEHTQVAARLGYTTVLLPPPYYCLPTQDELLAHYQTVLAETDVNIMLYNFPLRAGVEVGYEVMDALAENPRVLGIKESSGNLLRALEIDRRYGDKIPLCCGSDDQAFDFFLWGAKSWICAPANCLSAPIVKFYNAFTAGDLATAQAVARAIYPVMNDMEAGKFVQKIKYGCELLGLPVGLPRKPLLPLNENEKKAFGSLLQSVLSATA
ncbi:MAG: dihydrodipicolinate synthase family protein [Acetobacter sp.]